MSIIASTLTRVERSITAMCGSDAFHHTHSEQQDEIEAKLEELRNLDDKTLSDKNEDIVSMIKYYNELTNAVEERRNKIYADSLTFVGIIVAAATILCTIANWTDYLVIPIVFFCVQLLVQLTLICKFYIQNDSGYLFNDGQLKPHSNQWKWFYYGNSHIGQINVNKPDSSSIRSYIDGFKLFADNYLHEDVKSQISSNIQQLYLLQVHNFYKNRYYLQLVKIQRNGFILSIMAAAITVIAVLVPVVFRYFFNF